MMMEPNCEMKTTTTMKTQSTQPVKEIFNDSFFIRKSIISDAKNIANNNSIQAVNEELPIDNCQLAIDHQKKNSFMKPFLRKPFVIAIAVVIANLFLVTNAFAKTTTWTNAAGGAWTTAGNWNNGLPVA